MRAGMMAAKDSFARENIAKQVKSMLDLISNDMRKRATENMNNVIMTVEGLENLPEKILRFGWCGDQECGKKIEERTELKNSRLPLHKGRVPW